MILELNLSLFLAKRRRMTSEHFESIGYYLYDAFVVRLPPFRNPHCQRMEEASQDISKINKTK